MYFTQATEKSEPTNTRTFKLSKMPVLSIPLTPVEFFTTGHLNCALFWKVCGVLERLGARTTVYTFMYTTDGRHTWKLQYVIFMYFEEKEHKCSFLSILNHTLAKGGLQFQFQEQRCVPIRYLVGLPVDILPIECPPAPPAPMKIMGSRSINRKDRPPPLCLDGDTQPVNDPSTQAPSIAKTMEMQRRANAGNLFPREWGASLSKLGKAWAPYFNSE